MVKLRLTLLAVACVLLQTHCDRRSETPAVVIETEPTVSALISTFLEGAENSREIRFAEVIEASTGHLAIPLDPGDEMDARVCDEISSAMDASLEYFNGKESPTNGDSKISKVTFRFMVKICEMIDAAPGLSCARSRTKDGILPKSGYPDLRIVNEETGRVIYLVPKMVEQGSLSSSLRSFYFTPKGGDGLVKEDAHHFLVGIEHNGKTGAWKFRGWHLVDLANLKVRIKAEFQGSNKNLYQPDLIISRSQKQDF